MPDNMEKGTVRWKWKHSGLLILFIHLADERNSIKKMECTGLRPAEGIITTITIRFIETLSACLTTSQKGSSQLMKEF